MNSTNPKVSDAAVLDALRHSKPVNDASAARASQVVAERRALRERLDEIEAEKGPLTKRYLAAQAEHEVAQAAAKQAERAYQAAVQKAQRAFGAKLAASSAISLRTGGHRRRTEEGGRNNAAIDAFIRDMRDDMTVTRRLADTVETVAHNKVTGASRMVLHSNGASVSARLLAISEAMREPRICGCIPIRPRFRQSLQS